MWARCTRSHPNRWRAKHDAGRAPSGGCARSPNPLEEVGPLPRERQWGTVREDYSHGRQRLGLLHPRPGALAGLPLGRGRPGRHLRRPASGSASRSRSGTARPDPQGAAVRADQQRGQPRRGRQGVLLLPRQHADPLVHEVPLQVPAGGVPVRRTCLPTNRAPHPPRAASTSCSTPASSTTTATSTCFVEYAKAAPEDILIRITVDQPRAGAGHAARAADAVVPQHVGVGRRRRAPAAAGARPPDRRIGVIARLAPRAGRRYRSDAEARRRLLFTENETNAAAAVRHAERDARTSRTPSTTTSSTGGATP